MFSVHRASKRVGFKEVGEEEDWNLYWTDYSVSLERVMEMKRYQVRMADNIHTPLSVPRHNLSFGSRAFRVSAPKVWNSLPFQIRQSESLPTFKRHLKTNCFQSAYLTT